MPTFAEKMQKALGAAPPAAWVRLVTEDVKAHNGRFIVDLPGYDSRARFALKFDDKRLLAPEELLVDATPKILARYVPLALIDGGPELLVLDRTRESVCLWQHETGAFVDIAPSLPAFLASLKDGKELKREEAARKQAFMKAGKLARSLLPEVARLQSAGDHAGVAALLGPALAGVVPVRYPGHGGGLEEATNLGTVFDAHALALWQLGRRSEAIAMFTAAYGCGGALANETYLHTVFAMLAAGQLDAARAFEVRSQALTYLFEYVSDDELAAAVASLELDAASWKAIAALLAGAPRDKVSTGLRKLVRHVRAGRA